MNWKGIGGMLGGWQQPGELSNEFGLAVPGNLASVRSLVAGSLPFGRVKDDYAGTANPNRVKDDYAGPMGRVKDDYAGPLGRVKDDAVARLQSMVAGRPGVPGGLPAASLQSMVAGRPGVPGGLPAAPMQSMVASRPGVPGGLPAAAPRPSAFGNFLDSLASLDYTRAAPGLTSFADQNRQAKQFATDMGRYAPTTFNGLAGLVSPVNGMSMAPETAGIPSRSTAMTPQQERDYAFDRRESPTTWTGAAPAARPTPPAAQPTANVAAARPALGGAFNTIGTTSRPAPSVPAARPAAPSAPRTSSVTYAPGTAPSNPSQLGGITMADPKGTAPATSKYSQPLEGVSSWGIGSPLEAKIAGILAEQVAVPQPIQTVATPTPYTGYGPTGGPPAPPRATAYDVYSGLADTAMDNTGQNRVSSIPGGTSVTNKFGATTGMVNGYQTAVGSGSMPSVPSMSMPSKSTVRGAITGAGIGASFGPLGALAGLIGGGALASAMAKKNGTAPSVPGQTGGGLSALFGNIFGGGKTTGAAKSGVSSGKTSGASKSSGSASLGSNPNSKSLRI